MRRVLAILRRAGLLGVISLCLVIFVGKISYDLLLERALELSGLTDGILFFYAISPILYILLLIISSFLIRSFGVSASYHRSLPFVSTVLGCIKSDITAPFRLIRDLFSTLFGTYPEEVPDYMISGSRRIYFFRLIVMIVYFATCAFSLMIIKWNI